MVAPGAHFEFFEAPSFKARTRHQPELVEALEAFVRQRFDRLQALDEGVAWGVAPFRGQRFGFVVLKLGASRLCLQQVWDADLETLDEASLDAAMKLRRKP